MTEIYVDADACPVKTETCRVAKRYGLNVTFVSNTPMRIPDPETAKQIVVTGQIDAADDWIAGHASGRDIVVTADIPLAYRCIQNGARVVGPDGRVFSEENIGQCLATRNLLSELRGMGNPLGGPLPFQKRDRSRFLQNLDRIVQDVRRAANSAPPIT